MNGAAILLAQILFSVLDGGASTVVSVPSRGKDADLVSLVEYRSETSRMPLGGSKKLTECI